MPENFRRFGLNTHTHTQTHTPLHKHALPFSLFIVPHLKRTNLLSTPSRPFVFHPTPFLNYCLLQFLHNHLHFGVRVCLSMYVYVCYVYLCELSFYVFLWLLLLLLCVEETAMLAIHN